MLAVPKTGTSEPGVARGSPHLDPHCLSHEKPHVSDSNQKEEAVRLDKFTALLSKVRRNGRAETFHVVRRNAVARPEIRPAGARGFSARTAR